MGREGKGEREGGVLLVSARHWHGLLCPNGGLMGFILANRKEVIMYHFLLFFANSFSYSLRLYRL